MVRREETQYTPESKPLSTMSADNVAVRKFVDIRSKQESVRYDMRGQSTWPDYKPYLVPNRESQLTAFKVLFSKMPVYSSGLGFSLQSHCCMLVPLELRTQTTVNRSEIVWLHFKIDHFKINLNRVQRIKNVPFLSMKYFHSEKLLHYLALKYHVPKLLF